MKVNHKIEILDDKTFSFIDNYNGHIIQFDSVSEMRDFAFELLESTMNYLIDGKRS